MIIKNEAFYHGRGDMSQNISSSHDAAQWHL